MDNENNRQAVFMTANNMIDSIQTIKFNKNNLQMAYSLKDGFNAIKEAMLKLKESKNEPKELLILINAHGKYEDGNSYIGFEKIISVEDFYNNIKKIKEETKFSGKIHTLHSQCHIGGIKKNVTDFDNLTISFQSSKKDKVLIPNMVTIFQITLDAFLNNQEYIISTVIKSLALGIRLDILIPLKSKENPENPENPENLNNVQNNIFSKNKFILDDIYNIAIALDKLNKNESNKNEVISAVQKIIEEKVNKFLKKFNNILEYKIDTEIIQNIIKQKISSINDIKSLLLNTYSTALQDNFKRKNKKMKIKKDFLYNEESINNTAVEKQKYINEIVNNKIFKQQFTETKYLQDILKLPINFNDQSIEFLFEILNKIYNDEKKAIVFHDALDNCNEFDFKIFLQITYKYSELKEKDVNIKEDKEKISTLLSSKLNPDHIEELMNNYTKLNSEHIKILIKLYETDDEIKDKDIFKKVINNILKKIGKNKTTLNQNQLTESIEDAKKPNPCNIF